jgi:hypothetical protein
MLRPTLFHFPTLTSDLGILSVQRTRLKSGMSGSGQKQTSNTAAARGAFVAKVGRSPNDSTELDVDPYVQMRQAHQLLLEIRLLFDFFNTIGQMQTSSQPW